MTKLEAIAASKTFHKEADELLQRMKAHKGRLMDTYDANNGPGATVCHACVDFGEVLAQHTLSIRDLESCIMRQGMALKYIGNPDPYPESRNPNSPKVEPTADNLKM